MAKKKTKKKEEKVLKCPHCDSAESEWTIRGSADIHWPIGASDEGGVAPDGTILPEEGVDWDNVVFGKKYELQCGDCGEYFDIPKGFKLQPGWG